MKPEIKAEWLRRLRSGEYTQGKKRLRVTTAKGEERYCCLGILCEMAVEQGVIKSEPLVGDKYSDYKGTAHAYGNSQSWNRATTVLPPEVILWAGFPADKGLPLPVSIWVNPWGLAIKNDEGMPFSEIADFIEARA